MIKSIEYYDEKKRLISISNQNSFLQIIDSKGVITSGLWGAQFEDSTIPTGCFAYLNDIELGLWDCYFPKYIGIKINFFTVWDNFFHEHKFLVVNGNVLLGIQISLDKRRYIYCVLQKNTTLSSRFSFWPKIVNILSLSSELKKFS